jgi:hypothetical protein
MAGPAMPAPAQCRRAALSPGENCDSPGDRFRPESTDHDQHRDCGTPSPSVHRLGLASLEYGSGHGDRAYFPAAADVRSRP